MALQVAPKPITVAKHILKLCCSHRLNNKSIVAVQPGLSRSVKPIVVVDLEYW